MAGEELFSVLKWQVESGADEAIGEEPVDRFAENLSASANLANAPTNAPTNAPNVDTAAGPAAPPPVTAPQAQATQTPAPPTPPTNAGDTPGAVSAYETAAAATSIDDIRAALESFEGCPLRQTATNLVYTDGTPEARVVFVGEAPGAEEDRQGLPFVGPAGKLLDRMLGSIGLDRTQVLITNTLFWRPPGNRNPTPAEAAACLPFVERTIEIIDPDVLVLVGGTAAKTLLARQEGIMRLRGKWYEYQTARMARPVPTMAIFHPAFLLRSPGQKRATWRDMIEIKKHLIGNP
jgi:DNA polymerase